MAKKAPAAEAKKQVQVVEKQKIKIKPGKPQKEEKKTKTPAKATESKKIVKKPAAKTQKLTPKKPVVEAKGDRLPGQKHDTPEENDGTRIFYESLLKQKPDSKMAMKWCVENGVLDENLAQKYIKILEKKK